MGERVSIVVCAYNDQATVARVVRAAVAQRVDDLEVLVIDDASSDETPRILSSLESERLRVLRNPENLGLGASMNRGWQAAGGNVVVFLQSDCVPSGETWLEQLLLPFADPEVGVVVSRRRVPPAASMPLGARLFHAVCPQDLGGGDAGADTEIELARGKADAVRRSLLEDLGGFDKGSFFTAGEDTDFSYRVRQRGFRIVLSGRAEVENILSGRQTTVLGGLRKAILYGSAAPTLYRRYGYDGLQTRAFLVATTVAGLSILPLPQEAKAVSLFALSLAAFSVSIRLGALSMRVPVGLLMLGGIVLALPVANRPAGAVVGGTALAASLVFSVGSVRPALRGARESGAVWFPVFFLYAAVWRALSGIGYARARWRRFHVTPEGAARPLGS